MLTGRDLTKTEAHEVYTGETKPTAVNTGTLGSKSRKQSTEFLVHSPLQWNLGRATSSSHRYASSRSAASRRAFVPVARV